MMNRMTMTPAAKIIAQLPEYPQRSEANDMGAYTKYRKQIAEQVQLPTFYVLPKEVPVYTITVHPHDTELYSVTVTDDQGKLVEVPDPHDVEDTFDYIQDELKADVVFAGDIHLVPSNAPDDGTPSFNQMIGNTVITVLSGHDNVRLLTCLTTATQHYYAKDHYLQWLHQTTRYEADPNDFVNAHNWATGHPAFWSQGQKNHPTWNTLNQDNFRMYAIKDDEGTPYITIHVYIADPNNRSAVIHDHKLNGYGTTYEQAFLETAAKLYSRYNIDGTLVT